MVSFFFVLFLDIDVSIVRLIGSSGHDRVLLSLTLCSARLFPQRWNEGGCLSDTTQGMANMPRRDASTGIALLNQASHQSYR